MKLAKMILVSTLVIVGVLVSVGITRSSSENKKMDLPDPLKTLDGKKVASAEIWRAKRRPEILELFRKHVYGRAPVGRPKNMKFKVEEVAKDAFGGLATRKLVRASFEGPGGKGSMRISVYVPNKAKGKPAPGFLLISHRAFGTVDPGNKGTNSFWPAKAIVERGYTAAVCFAQDIDPDKYDKFKNGVHGIFDKPDTPRAPDAWATIAAWAWGASRAMDYFETDADIDAKRIGVLGHSRGGKTSLWCGAEDQRFAMVISNNSGCSGAALARRKSGETVARINRGFPHWFCDNYSKFNGKEENLPVDQHMLVALAAPRPVYVASASKDSWADPLGEFLACVHAAGVYKLFGLKGLGAAEMPKPESPLQSGHIGYHVRTGRHGLTEYDWKCYMDFADKHFKKK
ncbi:MAG: acetylxylan esterase [Phycisphaerae bacterium]|jgi:dienelactone hydrolase|nr:acetylxylan esterase [Phycisphaerae bacterium]